MLKVQPTEPAPVPVLSEATVACSAPARSVRIAAGIVEAAADHTGVPIATPTEWVSVRSMSVKLNVPVAVSGVDEPV